MTANQPDISNKDLLNILLALKEEGNNNKEEIKKKIQNESEKLLKAVEEQSEKIIVLEKKCTELETKCLFYERKIRKNNVVIFGLKAPETNLLEFILEKVNQLLSIQLIEADINNVFTVKTDKNTHIRLEFVSYLKKSLVLKNAPKLKGSRIFIAEDLCYDDRKNRKILVEHLKYAKSKNLLTKIVGNRLQVNNEIYTIEQLNAMGYIHKNNEEEEHYLAEKSNSAPPTPTLAVSKNCLIELESTATTSKNTDISKESLPLKGTKQEDKKRKLEQTIEKEIDLKFKKTTGSSLRSSSRTRPQDK